MFDLHSKLVHYHYSQKCLESYQALRLTPYSTQAVYDWTASQWTSSPLLDQFSIESSSDLPQGPEADDLWTLQRVNFEYVLDRVSFMDQSVLIGNSFTSQTSIDSMDRQEQPLSSPDIQSKRSNQFFILVGLFTGCSSDPISCKKTALATNSAQILNFNERIPTKILLQDLPRASFLSFVLAKAENEKPVAWVNFNLFDEEAYFRGGEHTVNMWPATRNFESSSSQFNYTGTKLKPRKSQLKIQFKIASPTNKVLFPDKDTIRRHIKQNQDLKNYQDFTRNLVKSNSTLSKYIHLAFNESRNSDLTKVKLEALCGGDPIANVSKDQLKLLWSSRISAMKIYPDCLPLMVQAVDWSKKHEVMNFYELLWQWPASLSLEASFALLGCNGCADPFVREFAVRTLDQKLSNYEMSLYLLQLVQALKVESYLFNPLSVLLMRRALENPTLIGSPLFWHLRSEIEVEEAMLRFSLFLEAFCRGCGPFLQCLKRQVDAIRILGTISCDIKVVSISFFHIFRFLEQRHWRSKRNKEPLPVAFA
ncbi:Phosphatidylinositol 4,5-bisphosphate 3-kinase catalytic subunit alpha isoform [Cichlidogyrus casuarinus]|uniref:Phosphatidylinositol 4,5-bisphosphate 3-kinase catalytic subunit alpha isoform n=1 Tax=Cichlidogyrus casuarinus TaxID=1844966 RepID=A0ABD2QL10_9PLAT